MKCSPTYTVAYPLGVTEGSDRGLPSTRHIQITPLFFQEVLSGKQKERNCRAIGNWWQEEQEPEEEDDDGDYVAPKTLNKKLSSFEKKLDRLETHDRLIEFKKEQALNIFQGANDCLTKNDTSVRLQQYCPYIYLFAHLRTADDGYTKRMLWQPRLTKPKAQTNSYLFRAISGTDQIEVCWLLPPREMWLQYQAGNVTESDIVLWSIHQFKNNRVALESPFQDDLSEEQSKNIYIKVAAEIDEEKMMKKLYTKPSPYVKPSSSEAFLTV